MAPGWLRSRGAPAGDAPRLAAGAGELPRRPATLSAARCISCPAAGEVGDEPGCDEARGERGERGLGEAGRRSPRGLGEGPLSTTAREDNRGEGGRRCIPLGG